MALSLPLTAEPNAVEFNPVFLGPAATLDLGRFTHGNPIDPGVYRVDISVNGTHIDQQDVRFIATADPDRAAPCLTRALILRMDINPTLISADVDPARCIDLSRAVPSASVAFDPDTLTLEASIPQAALVPTLRGGVARSLWTYGSTAAFASYSLSVQESGGQRDAWLGLTSGANLGAWRFRHRGSMQTQPRGGTAYASQGNTLQRSLPAWNSELLLGQAYTDGRLFDAMAFTGVQLMSDERMLPDGIDGYAPVVRGIAPGTARVTIRQNGVVLRELTVAPGPFEISDLSPGLHGGALDVTVAPTEGPVQRFKVHTASVPQALRAGTSRHAVTAGRLRDTRDELDSAPRFIEASWAVGINNTLTMLAGVRASAGYQALLAGSAVTTPIGAFGADVTASHATRDGSTPMRGTSLRLSYQRSFVTTGTHVGLATVRHGSRHFVTLADAARWRAAAGTTLSDAEQHPRQQIQVYLSQRIATHHSMTASGNHTRYRDGRPALIDYQFGIQHQLRSGHVDLSAHRARVGGRDEDSLQARYSVPLGTTRRSRLAASALSGKQGGSARLSLHGSAPTRSGFGYSVAAGGTGSGNRDYNATASWQTGTSDLSALAAWSDEARSTIAAAASGAIVVHGGGINTSPTLFDGFLLVAAPGAIGARVAGDAIRIGRNGHAVLPGLTPFRWNEVNLDLAGLPHDIVLTQNSLRVAPTAGAMVKVFFDTRVQTVVYIRAKVPAGTGRPAFGSDVRNAQGEIVGTVGQGGLLTVQGEHGRVWVNVGPRYCVVTYTTPQRDLRGMRITESNCLMADTPPESPTALSPAALSPAARTPAPSPPSAPVAQHPSPSSYVPHAGIASSSPFPESEP